MCTLHPLDTSLAATQTISVVFRYDDYGNERSLQHETVLREAFAKYDIPATYGIIPYPSIGDVGEPGPHEVRALELSKAELIKDMVQAGKIEAALHGYSHHTRWLWPYSEFAGADITEQRRKITAGKLLLEEMLGVEIVTFIPPWNTYDTDTVRALEDAGFRTLSSGASGPVTPSNLAVLPATCGLGELQSAVEYVRGLDGRGYVIVVLFHAYNFVEVDTKHGTLNYEEFERLLEWVARQPDVSVSTLKQAAGVETGYNMDCLREHGVSRMRPPLLPTPPFVGGDMRPLLYYPADFTQSEYYRG